MKTCEFRASSVKKELKQAEQTQFADANHVTSVLKMTQLEAIPRHYYVS